MSVFGLVREAGTLSGKEWLLNNHSISLSFYLYLDLSVFNMLCISFLQGFTSFDLIFRPSEIFTLNKYLKVVSSLGHTPRQMCEHPYKIHCHWYYLTKKFWLIKVQIRIPACMWSYILIIVFVCDSFPSSFTNLYKH